MSEIGMEKEECLNAVIKLLTSPEFCQIKWECVTVCLDTALIHVHRTSTPSKDVFDFKYHQCFLDKCTHSFCTNENCSFNRGSEGESESESEVTRRVMSSENSSTVPDWCPAVHSYLKKVLRPCCHMKDNVNQIKAVKKSFDKDVPPTIVAEVDEEENLQGKPVEDVKKQEGSPTNKEPTMFWENGNREYCKNEIDTNDKKSDATYTVGADLHDRYFNYLNKDLTDLVDINGSKQNDAIDTANIYNLFSGITNSARDERIFQEFRRAFSEAVERIEKAEIMEDKDEFATSAHKTFITDEDPRKEEKEYGQKDGSDFKYKFKNHQDIIRVKSTTKETKQKNLPKPRKNGKNSKKEVHHVVNSSIDDTFLEDCLKHVYIGNPYGSHLKDCYCFDCSKPDTKETDRDKAVENPRRKVRPTMDDHLNECRPVSSQACLCKSPLKVNRRNGRKLRKLRKIVTSDKTVEGDIAIPRLSKKGTVISKSIGQKKANSEPGKETKNKIPDKIKAGQKKTNEELIKTKGRLLTKSIRSRTSYETCPPILSRDSTSSTYDPKVYEYKNYSEAKRYLRKC